MLITNLKEMNAIYGILEKVANEVNDYYWKNNSEVDYERASALRDLEEYLINHNYIDSGFDLAALTHKMLYIYPQSVTTVENNRQYHEVLNKLDLDVRRTLLWDMRNMEKDSGEKLDKSVKFNMALEKLLESTSDES